MLFLSFVFLGNSTLQIHCDGVLAHYTLHMGETRSHHKGTGLGEIASCDRPGKDAGGQTAVPEDVGTPERSESGEDLYQVGEKVVEERG